MKMSVRTLILSSFVVALGSVGVFAGSSRAREAAIDLWNVNEYQHRRDMTEQQTAELDRQNEVVLNRVLIKEEILADLLDGRITFPDAASRFAQLNRQASASPKYLMMYQGRTEEERAARQLVIYLRSRPGPAAHALAEAWDCILRGKELELMRG